MSITFIYQLTSITGSCWQICSKILTSYFVYALFRYPCSTVQSLLSPLTVPQSVLILWTPCFSYSVSFASPVFTYVTPHPYSSITVPFELSVISFNTGQFFVKVLIS